jgi:hypothetical protein
MPSEWSFPSRRSNHNYILVRISRLHLQDFSPEDGDSMILRNVGTYLRFYTAPKPRRTTSTVHQNICWRMLMWSPRPVSAPVWNTTNNLYQHRDMSFPFEQLMVIQLIKNVSLLLEPEMPSPSTLEISTGPVLSQFESVHFITTHFHKIHFPPVSTRQYPKWSLLMSYACLTSSLRDTFSVI